MTTSLKSVAEAHADHRERKSELDSWVDDIVNWKNEQIDALGTLKKIADEIYDQGRAFDVRSESLIVMRSDLEAHEKAMAASLRTGVEGDLDAELNQRHEQHNAEHAKQREIHERIKKNHHQAMAQVKSLKVVMDAVK